MPAADLKLKRPHPLHRSNGFVVLTPSLLTMGANHVISRLIGYDPKPGKPFPLDKLFCKQELIEVKSEINRTIKSGQPKIKLKAELLYNGGNKSLCSYSVYPLFKSTRIVTGVILCFEKVQKQIHLPETAEFHHSFKNIIGKSEKMQRLFTMLPDIAESDANVLICGESGTGKDLFAETIHTHSLRSKGPYIAVNCATFAESLIESELFGHEKSAFTGADRLKIGRFEMAGAGTLFLDEIGELKPELQVKLLRVLDQRKFERVGGTKPVLMEARIISATNKNLTEAIADKSFREDFYYRLRTVSLNLPPLREKKEDIPLLVNHFIRLFNKKYNKEIRSVDTKVMRFFQQYHFPGNVRELEQAMEHAYVFAKGPVIFLSSLPDFKEFNMAKPEPELETTPKEILFTAKKPDKEAILHALSLSNGKRQKAADLLSISRTSLWRLIKKLELG